MPARFLPALRGKTPLAAAASEAEVKAVYSDYYNALWQYETHRRARPWPVERAVTEGFERVIWVFKAVTTIAADSARLPYKLRQGKDVVDDHPLCRVLNRRANPLESGQVFRKRLSAQVLLSKAGAFVEQTLSRGGDVVRLDLLPPDRTEIIPGRGADLVSHVRLQRRDGSYRDIDWDKVLWFRGDPHPLDPYSGVTPLEAAGMSVELDYFARLYNVSFMRNDGRPGGVLAVRGPNGEIRDVSERQMDRIEERFQGGVGPHEAGKLSVVAGELSYVDLATRPRDMQYGSTSKNSKIELLSAFGVPETILGYSAERTYSNAGDEKLNYWTRTMPAHNEILVAGFDESTDDDLVGFLDTSSVEVLEEAERAKRDEARTEVDKGLRSIWSYAMLAGLTDLIEETPHTRALYIANGRTPLPAKMEDAEALGLATEVEAPPAAPQLPPGAGPGGQPGPGPGEIEGTAAAGQDAPPAPPAAPSPAAGGAPSQGGGGPVGGVGGGASGGAAARALAAASKSRRRPVLRVVRDRETKAAGDQEAVSDPDQRARDRLEDAIAATLTALATRWTERALTRIESPKARKGTRHWVAEHDHDTRVGTKALDAARAVDEQAWADEARTSTEPILTAAAIAAAAALYADLDTDTTPAQVGRLVASVVYGVANFIADSAARQAAALIRLINRGDQAGLSVPEITTEVRAAARLTTWADGIATQAATATTNGARDAAATDVAAGSSDQVKATWVTRRDDKVRPSHHQAHGQVQPVGQPFIVGASLLRYPGDELAPIEETANCRCWLQHRSVRTGRYVPAPVQATG